MNYVEAHSVTEATVTVCVLSFPSDAVMFPAV